MAAVLSAPAARHDDDGIFALTLAVSGALAHLRACEARAAARALAVGDIDLPDLGEPPPAQFETQVLQPLPALYLASQLEASGLLRTGELVAGLFASGAIGGPLPTKVGEALHAFWRGRHERLVETERAHLFATVFGPTTFDPLMRRLCEALVALADNAGIDDIRENVGVEHAATMLADALWPAISGMASFAAKDVVDAIGAALKFLKERPLQLAFGVADLWGLVAVTNRAEGVAAQSARDFVERGRNGMTVLRWLVDAVAKGARLDLADPQAGAVIAAAERWLLASGKGPR